MRRNQRKKPLRKLPHLQPNRQSHCWRNCSHLQSRPSTNKKKLTCPLSHRKKRLHQLLLQSISEENPLSLNLSIWVLKLLCHLPLSSFLNHKLQPRLVSSFHLKITVCASYKLLCANLKRISTLCMTDLQAGSPCTLHRLQSWRSKWVRKALPITSR
jgi:hypothetical protein